jgi:Tol biopolymer transport system component
MQLKFSEVRYVLRTIVVSGAALAAVSCDSGTAPDGRVPELRIATTTIDNAAVSIFNGSGARLKQISCGSGCSLYDPQWAEDAGELAILGIKDLNSVLYIADTAGIIRELTRSPSYLRDAIQGTTRRVFRTFSQTWSPSGRLAYVQDDTILVATEQHGGDPRVVLIRPSGLSSIDWIPGDTAISFVSQNRAFVARLSGSGVTSITDLPGSVRAAIWSPDGAAAALVLTQANRTTLYRYDVVGRSMNALATFDTIGSVCWSSDSKGIAFVAEDFPSAGKAYVSKLDGNAPVEITVIGNASILGWLAKPKLLAIEVGGVTLYDTDSWKPTTLVSLEPKVNFIDVAGAKCSEKFYLLPDS